MTLTKALALADGIAGRSEGTMKAKELQAARELNRRSLAAWVKVADSKVLFVDPRGIAEARLDPADYDSDCVRV